MKKVGILGSGAVAKALAKGFLANNYEVMMGTSNADKLKDLAGVKIGSFEETSKFSDLLVLAVKGHAAVKVLANCDTAGKTIIDTNNPIDEKPPVNGVLSFYTDLNSSLGEQLQSAYPTANIVKAFNSVGSSQMVNPDYNGIKPSMFICGNNEASKNTVKEILTAFGWETEDMGSIEASRAIEPLCMLWCIPGFKNNQWTHAFKLLKK